MLSVKYYLYKPVELTAEDRERAIGIVEILRGMKVVEQIDYICEGEEAQIDAMVLLENKYVEFIVNNDRAYCSVCIEGKRVLFIDKGLITKEGTTVARVHTAHEGSIEQIKVGLEQLIKYDDETAKRARFEERFGISSAAQKITVEKWY